ncbi:MAG TPA: hypothetical protein VGP26_31290 [Actinophytocola sp.]|nr:hypothetical protein [Actinophytocola sp.]
MHAGRAPDLFRDGGAGTGYLRKDRVTEVDEFTDAMRRVARAVPGDRHRVPATGGGLLNHLTRFRRRRALRRLGGWASSSS